jgi:predicted ATPase
MPVVEERSVEREPVIRNLTIQGFRSVARERIELDNLTFLVGRNGTGKSNIVDAFALLGEAMTRPLPNLISSRGGIATVFHKSPGAGYPLDFGLEVEFGSASGEVRRGTYGFLTRATSERHFDVRREKFWTDAVSFDRQGGLSLSGPFIDHLPQPHTAPDSLLLPVLSGVESYAPAIRALSAISAYDINPGRLREPAAPDNGWALLPDGRNAASVLQEIHSSSPDDYEAISDFLSVALPYSIEVRSVPHSPSRLALEMIQTSERGQITLEALSASEGTLRLLGLLLAVFQPTTPSVLLFEEPEATIHPDAFGIVLDLLKHAARSTQVIVTTHSPELLDAKWIEDRHLRVVHWEEGATWVSPIAAGARQALQDHLMGAGELLRSRALDAPPLSRREQEPILFEHAR